ncbi:MAG: flavodoxin family protein [Erysipelotrichaceae bacterium]|nr:flavodoxin family protein [Erysipelotrichaceae bacterium]
MKVLLINGSPNVDGCTNRALDEMISVFEKEGVEYEKIQVGKLMIHGCVGCKQCKYLKRCALDNDIVNDVARKFEEADGLVIGSPVYMGSAAGTMVSFLDRLFYSTRYTFDKRYKVGASVVSARRSGNTFTFEQLNQYFLVSEMPIAAGVYWNNVFGYTKEDVEKDLEGLQSMRVLARNMIHLMRSLKLGEEKYGLFEKEPRKITNFSDGL